MSTAEGAAALGAPRWSPEPRELDDLEVLLQGGYAPLAGFLGPEDVAAVYHGRRLAGGAPWPVPVTLAVPSAVASSAAAAGRLELLDEEGTPVAAVEVERTWALDGDRSGVSGPVTPLRALERGSHRELRRSAASFRASAPAPLLGVPVVRPLHEPDLAALRLLARQTGARLLLLPLTGQGSPEGLDGPGLVRACLGVRAALGADVVPVAVPAHGDPARDRALAALVAAAYGATHVPGAPDPAALPAGVRAVTLPLVAQDGIGGTWQPLPAGADADGAAARIADVPARVAALVATGQPVPATLSPPAVVRELRRSHRPGGGRGFAVLLTGLSGSGKSTVARALHAALLDRSDRTVTLLDGDVVRRMLSSELGFDRAHRELNVRRIGYVAGEVARHGGVALCAPIAPYAALRAEVRAMVEAHGGFLLVHVATPLAVCEARDRKGLYAKARAGLIPEFTGVSDPYEEPEDADLVVDTSDSPLGDIVESILRALTERGWLALSS